MVVVGCVLCSVEVEKGFFGLYLHRLNQTVKFNLAFFICLLIFYSPCFQLVFSCKIKVGNV